MAFRGENITKVFALKKGSAAMILRRQKNIKCVNSFNFELRLIRRNYKKHNISPPPKKNVNNVH